MFVEYIETGDMMKVLNKFKQMPKDMAAFYAAQIVVCFEYLHEKDLLFRDLKPENVLVAPDGYIKLADFGFVRTLKSNERTYTFCGTPEYIAPEIITNQGYSHPVDWYALGILIYELIYGRPPFMASSPLEVFDQVLQKKIPFTEKFDKNAKSLVKHLCDKDLSKRYGVIAGGITTIKMHRFFNGINW